MTGLFHFWAPVIFSTIWLPFGCRFSIATVIWLPFNGCQVGFLYLPVACALLIIIAVDLQRGISLGPNPRSIL